MPTGIVTKFPNGTSTDTGTLNLDVMTGNYGNIPNGIGTMEFGAVGLPFLNQGVITATSDIIFTGPLDQEGPVGGLDISIAPGKTVSALQGMVVSGGAVGNSNSVAGNGTLSVTATYPSWEAAS
jgi:hypothetical protein